jgi:hypothetical protein
MGGRRPVRSQEVPPVLLVLAEGEFGYDTRAADRAVHSNGGRFRNRRIRFPVAVLAVAGILTGGKKGDVSKLRAGQRAYVTAEAYGTHKFWGRVIRVGRILGKKNIRTDEPSEHVDTKILETLVELDAGQQLPLGLRVDSYVQSE